MYKPFYKLDKKPFEINPDLSFLWLGKKHEEALSTLHYGIIENKGFLLLTGEAGSGKTTLIKALTENPGEDIVWAIIADPQLARIDFYNVIAKEFGLGKLFTSKVQFLLQFSHFLHKANDEKKKVLLLVDDCHLLSQEMLEELRLLSNIEKADAKLINIFLVGQPTFNDLLAEPKNKAMNQRLALQVDLQALNADETGEYLRHRLKVAGTEEEVFTSKAIQSIYRSTLGLPRSINALCDQLLARGAVQDRKIIDNKMIDAYVQEMGLSAVTPDKEDSTALKTPAFPTFNREDGKRYSWIKYVVGLLVIAVVGIYFSLPSLFSVDNGSKALPLAVKAPVVLQPIPQISSSPAVTVLEENKSILNGPEEAESKTAMLEKAAGSNAQLREKENLQAKEKVVVVGVSVAGGDHPTEKPIVKLQPTKKKKLKAATAPPVSSMPPLAPRKLILALQPGELKLTNAAAQEFDSFVKILKHYPRATMKVKGFVSAQSNSPDNIKLSTERALSVQKLLLARGVDATRIKVVGMGNKEPIASDTTSEGRRKNRRVEIVVIDDGVSRKGGN